MLRKYSNSFFVFLISISCTLTHAQDYSKHQLFAGYGFGYTNKVFGEIGKAFNVGFIQKFFSDSTESGKVMPLYIGYRYFLHKHFTLGFNLAYPLMNVESNSVTIQSKASSDQRFSAIVFLPRIDIIYVNKRIFTVYSGAGIGIIIENKDEVEAQQANIAPAYHITAIGLSVGKTVGFFTELGYGVNGVISLGIVTKFGEEDASKGKSSEPKGSKKKDANQPCIRL